MKPYNTFIILHLIRGTVAHLILTLDVIKLKYFLSYNSFSVTATQTFAQSQTQLPDW